METIEAPAQSPMQAEPQKQHRWLQQLIGEWTFESEDLAPDQPPTKCAGTELVRALGDLWVVCEGQGEMPGGGTASTLITLGYDPQKGRYVGTWIGSMMSHLWVCDGELDAAERVLTLHAEGPHMTTPGQVGQYKDVIELKDADHRVLTAHFLGDDGAWHHFITAHYRRQR